MEKYNKQNVKNRMNLSYNYSYFKNGLYSSHRLQEAVISALKNIPSNRLEEFDTLLEIGCGQGQWMNFFNVFLFGKLKLYGIDLSKHQIDALKHKFPHYQVSCANMTKLPYESNFFDLLTAFTSFMFLEKEEDLKQVFCEVNRVLKINGYLLIEDVYKKEGHFSGNQLLESKMAGYSVHELDRYALENGFERIFCKPVFKRLLWSRRSRLNTVNLPLYIGYTLTYLSEIFIPGEMNNFILLYKKIQ